MSKLRLFAAEFIPGFVVERLKITTALFTLSVSNESHSLNSRIFQIDIKIVRMPNQIVHFHSFHFIGNLNVSLSQMIQTLAALFAIQSNPVSRLSQRICSFERQK